MTEDYNLAERDALHLLDEVDDAILSSLRQACTQEDPVPVGLIERIQFEMTLAALRAEIAELEAAEPVGIRGPAPAVTDTLTFRSSSLSLMVRIGTPDQLDAEEMDLECWVSEGAARVEVFVAGALVRSATADQHGRVGFSGVARGSVRFVVHPVAGAPIATPAVEL